MAGSRRKDRVRVAALSGDESSSADRIGSDPHSPGGGGAFEGAGGEPIFVDPLDPAGWAQDPSVVAERVVFRLWSDGAVSGRSIEQARREVDGRGRLDHALIRLGVIDDETVARALFAELDVAQARAADFPAAAIAPNEIPARFVEETLAVPIDDDGDVLHLAMVDPLDDYALRAIAMKTRRRLAILAASPRLLRAEISRLYPKRQSRGAPILEDARPLKALPPPRPDELEAGRKRRRNAEPRGGREDRDEADVDGYRRRAQRRGDAARADAGYEGGVEDARYDPAPAERRAPREAMRERFGKPSFVRPKRVTLKDRGADARGGERVQEASRNRRTAIEAVRAAARDSAMRDAWPGASDVDPIDAHYADGYDDRGDDAGFEDLGHDERGVEDPSGRRFVGGFVGGFIGADPMAEPDAPDARRARRGSTGGARASAPAEAETRRPRRAERSDRATPPLTGVSLEERLAAISERLRARDPSPELIDSATATRRDLRVAQRRARHQKARELVLSEIRRSMSSHHQSSPARDTAAGRASDDPASARDRGAAAAIARSAQAVARLGGAKEAGTLRGPSATPADPETGSVTRHALSNAAALKLESSLGEQEAMRILETAAADGQGLIVLCGPPGAGKMQTLRMLADRLAGPSGVVDRFDAPGPDGALDRTRRPGGARDAGVRIAIGEIRDAESAEAAARIAMTGGLALAALNVPTTAAAGPRLIQMGLPPYAVASSLRAILAQSLVEGPCRVCSGAGCAECDHTGQVASARLVEAIQPDDTIRALILAGAPEGAFRHAMTSAEAGGASEAPRGGGRRRDRAASAPWTR